MARNSRLSRGFKNGARTFTAEFLEPRDDGLRIAAEFSTGRQKLSKKKSFLRHLSRGLPDGYRWVVYDCKTCAGYDEGTPIHCAILSDEEIDEYGIQLL